MLSPGRARAMPRLAFAKCSRVLSLNGDSNTETIRSAISAALRSSPRPASSITNSSPPRRAMRSSGRSAVLSLGATWISSSSPAA